MIEYMRALVLVALHQRGQTDGVPVLRRREVPTTLTIERLKEQDREVLDGYFCSAGAAREARLAILVERYGRSTAVDIARNLEDEEDE